MTGARRDRWIRAQGPGLALTLLVLVVCVGTLGFRWQKQKGQWNLNQKDAEGKDFDPALTLLG